MSIKEELLDLAKKWYDKGVDVKQDWYNDSAAYHECSDELERLADSIKEDEDD